MYNAEKETLIKSVHNNNFTRNITSELGNIEINSSFVDADGKTVKITDSKQITKRPKDLRNSLNQILNIQSKDDDKRLNKAGEVLSNIDPKIIRTLVPIFAEDIGNFVNSITGSKWYQKVVWDYVNVILSNSFLNYIKTSSTNNEVKKKSK